MMKKRVLVVDDKDHDRKHLVTELRSAGLQVKEAGWLDYESLQGRSMVRRFQPHYAVVDSKYAGELDGVEVVQMLREEVEDVRIVICTILSSIEEKADWVRQRYDLPGVVGVLGKRPLPSGREITSLFRG